MTSTFTITLVREGDGGSTHYLLVETVTAPSGVITFPGRRLSRDELDSLRAAVMSVVTPMTAEQINALPAAKGWWGFAVARRVVAVIRDVEAFYGVRR